jgi:hypothetical protein
MACPRRASLSGIAILDGVTATKFNKRTLLPTVESQGNEQRWKNRRLRKIEARGIIEVSPTHSWRLAATEIDTQFSHEIPVIGYRVAV